MRHAAAGARPARRTSFAVLMTKFDELARRLKEPEPVARAAPLCGIVGIVPSQPSPTR